MLVVPEEVAVALWRRPADLLQKPPCWAVMGNVRGCIWFFTGLGLTKKGFQKFDHPHCSELFSPNFGKPLNHNISPVCISVSIVFSISFSTIGLIYPDIILNTRIQPHS